jgi:hypothetical protein
MSSCIVWFVNASEHQAGRRIEAEDRCFSAVTLAPADPATPGRGGGGAITVCVTHLDQLSDELRLDQVNSPASSRCANLFAPTCSGPRTPLLVHPLAPSRAGA